VANSYRNAAGQNPEDVYEPDVVGDGPTAAIGGIGYRRADGTLLKFAARKYGTAAPNHGYRLADGRDFSALWCKKGTASYGLPIDGQTYSGTPTGAGSVSSVTFQFATSSSAWSLRDAGRSTSPIATGSPPSGATSCRVTLTRSAGIVADISNPLSAFTVLTSSTTTVSVGITQTEAGQPPLNSTYSMKVEYRDSGGAVISTTNCSLTMQTRPT